MSEYTERAIENLTNYQAPLDPDGIKVAVSREALEVALDEIQSLRQQLKEKEEQVERCRKSHALLVAAQNNN